MFLPLSCIANVFFSPVSDCARTAPQGVFPGDVDAINCSFRIHSRFNEPYIHLEIVKLTAAGKWKAGIGYVFVEESAHCLFNSRHEIFCCTYIRSFFHQYCTVEFDGMKADTEGPT